MCIIMKNIKTRVYITTQLLIHKMQLIKNNNTFQNASNFYIFNLYALSFQQQKKKKFFSSIPSIISLVALHKIHSCSKKITSIK